MTDSLGPDRDGRPLETALAAGAFALLLSLPLLEIAAANQAQGVGRRSLLVHYGWMLACGAGVTLLLRLILFRMPVWRILAALVPVAFGFLAYGPVTASLRFDSLQGAARLLLLAGWACVLMLVFWSGMRWLRTRRAIQGTLFVVVLLLIQPALSLVKERGQGRDDGSADVLSAAAPVAPGPVAARPDIYWLIADGYPRADVLRADFGFDNSAFEASLERRGFVVPRSAVANYPLTFLSVASMAAMDYVVDENTPEATVRDVKRFTRMMSGNSELVRQQRGMGYRYVHFTSGYEQSTMCSGLEDLCVVGTRDAIDEVGLLLLKRTPLLDFGLAVSPLSTKLSQRMPFSWRGFDALEDHLEEVHRVRRPFLLYAHVLDPHPPFRHNADCSIRPAAPDLMGWAPGRRAEFVAEIECVNVQLGRVLDAIIERNPQAIIVINGDHGSAFREQFSKTPEAWNGDDVRERFSPMLALRLPAQCRADGERLGSLVNVFRVVRSCLADVAPELLADRQFIANYNDSPFFGTVFPIATREEP